ncbi:hypothetical protein ElyMa_001124200 [Elysia marginata]|uniref:Uncharacterized protein n=1 Tax=Elysia marginata TaxID=1093978 RepID=A0AAV4I0J2_9GAST|nr:hypothetical protein ElyMa_001124200 [Elysia marginata]
MNIQLSKNLFRVMTSNTVTHISAQLYCVPEFMCSHSTIDKPLMLSLSEWLPPTLSGVTGRRENGASGGGRDSLVPRHTEILYPGYRHIQKSSTQSNETYRNPLSRAPRHTEILYPEDRDIQKSSTQSTETYRNPLGSVT